MGKRQSKMSSGYLVPDHDRAKESRKIYSLCATYSIPIKGLNIIICIASSILLLLILE